LQLEKNPEGREEKKEPTTTASELSGRKTFPNEHASQMLKKKWKRL
jgi:hypothetical protein